jgi:hypothetical protein
MDSTQVEKSRVWSLKCRVNSRVAHTFAIRWWIPLFTLLAESHASSRFRTFSSNRLTLPFTIRYIPCTYESLLTRYVSRGESCKIKVLGNVESGPLEVLQGLPGHFTEPSPHFVAKCYSEFCDCANGHPGNRVSTTSMGYSRHR